MLSIWLIALHMLGDYILQNNWMAANKFKNSFVRTVHVVCYTLPFSIFAWVWVHFVHSPRLGVISTLYFTMGIFILHWLTDCRRWASDKPWCAKPIMVDQTMHLLQLAVCGSVFLT